MGNASGRTSTIKHGHMRSHKHKGHHHSHKHMRSKHRHTHRYKNRTHRRRRYGGGLSPKVKSKLRKVFTAPVALLEESTTDDTLFVNPTKKSKEVFKIPSPTDKILSKKQKRDPSVAQHVKSALRTHGEVQEAREREHASKSPSKGKRSSKDDAGPMIAYKQWQDSNKKKEAERLLREEAKRKANAAAKKANEESFTPHQQTFGRAALQKYIPEEEEEVKPSAVKPLTPAERKKMNDAVKKSMKELAVLEEEDEEA